MKKLPFLFLTILCLFSCSEEEEKNLVITGKVEGLKEGTLYLQKIEDTNLVNIDSVVVDGDPNFTFETFIESPQIFYLFLKKIDNSIYDDRITFFAEPGEMTIHTTLENFSSDAVVKGSENQEKFLEYEEMMKQFNNKRLELIKADLLAKKAGNEKMIDSINKQFENLIRRRYLYTVNFAVNNKDLELAPYLAVTEISNANIKFLDTIYSSLNPEIKESKYGMDLKDFLEERHKHPETTAADSIKEN